MNLKHQKALHKAIKERRIEIEGRVWYIPLPGRPAFVKGSKIASKRGKRRAKSKSTAANKHLLVVCPRSKFVPRRPFTWNPCLIQMNLQSFIEGRKQCVIQPRFIHAPGVPILGLMKEPPPYTPLENYEEAVENLKKLFECYPTSIEGPEHEQR